MSMEPHAFSLRQLQYAVAVAEALSFRKAAERCHVSQPALSAQIAQLEQVLGTALFERDRRRVLVTAAGRELIERARAVLRETDDLVESARRAGNPLAGTLRIGIIPTISPYLLPRIAPALRRAYPALKLLWVEDKTEVLARSLNSGNLDAAVVALESDLGEVDEAVIASDPFVIAAAPDSALGSKRTPAKASELRDVGVLLLDDGHCFRDQALAICTEARASELEFRATSLTTLTQMVAAGAGVTLLPRLAVATETLRTKLTVRPFEEPAPQRTIALVWRRRSPLAGAFGHIVECIRSAYPNGEARETRGAAPKSAARPKRERGRARSA